MELEDVAAAAAGAVSARSSDQSSLGIIRLDSATGLSGFLGDDDITSPLSPVKQLRRNPAMSEIAENSLLECSGVSEELNEEFQSLELGLNQTGYADLSSSSQTGSHDTDSDSLSGGSLSDSDGGSGGSGAPASCSDPGPGPDVPVLDQRYIIQQSIRSGSSHEESLGLGDLGRSGPPLQEDVEPRGVRLADGSGGPSRGAEFSLAGQNLAEFGCQISARSTSIGGSVEARGDNTDNGFGNECFGEMAQLQEFDDGAFVAAGAEFEDMLRREEQNFDHNGLPRAECSLSSGIFDPHTRVRPLDTDESMSISQYMKAGSRPIGTLGDASVAESVPRFDMSLVSELHSPPQPGQDLVDIMEPAHFKDDQNSTASTVRRSRETFTMSTGSGYRQIHAGGPRSSAATADATVGTAAGTYTVLTAPLSPETSGEATLTTGGESPTHLQNRRTAADSLRRRIVDVLNRTEEARVQLLSSAGRGAAEDSSGVAEDHLNRTEEVRVQLLSSAFRGAAEDQSETAEDQLSREAGAEVRGMQGAFVATTRPSVARREAPALNAHGGTDDFWQQLVPAAGAGCSGVMEAGCPRHARDCSNGTNSDCDGCHQHTTENHHRQSQQHAAEDAQWLHTEHPARQHHHRGPMTSEYAAGILRQSHHFNSTGPHDLHAECATASEAEPCQLEPAQTAECPHVAEERTEELKRQQVEGMQQHRQQQMSRITEARAKQNRLRNQWEMECEMKEKADRQKRDKLLREARRKRDQDAAKPEADDAKRRSASKPPSKEAVSKESRESGLEVVSVVKSSRSLSSGLSQLKPEPLLAPSPSPPPQSVDVPAEPSAAVDTGSPDAPLDAAQLASELAEQVASELAEQVAPAATANSESAPLAAADISSVVSGVLQELSAYGAPSVTVQLVVEEVLRHLRSADQTTTSSLSGLDVTAVLQELRDTRTPAVDPVAELAAQQELPPPIAQTQSRQLQMMETVSRLHRGEPAHPRGASDRPQPPARTKPAVQRSVSNPAQRSAARARVRTASGRARAAEPTQPAPAARRSDGSQAVREPGSPGRRRPASTGLAVRGRRVVPRLGGARLSDEQPSATDDSERAVVTPRRPVSAGARRPRPPPRTSLRQTERGAAPTAPAPANPAAGSDSTSSGGSARTYSVESVRVPGSLPAADACEPLQAKTAASAAADAAVPPTVAERLQAARPPPAGVAGAYTAPVGAGTGAEHGLAAAAAGIVSDLSGAAGVDYVSPEFLVAQAARRYPSSTPSLGAELGRAVPLQDVSPIEPTSSVAIIIPPPAHWTSDEGPISVLEPVQPPASVSAPTGTSSTEAITVPVESGSAPTARAAPAQSTVHQPAAAIPEASAGAGSDQRSGTVAGGQLVGTSQHAPIPAGNVHASSERQSRARLPASKSGDTAAGDARPHRSRIPTPVRRSESSQSAPSLLSSAEQPVKSVDTGVQTSALTVAATVVAGACSPPSIGTSCAVSAAAKTEPAAAADTSSAATEEVRLVAVPAHVDHETVMCTDIETELHFTARNLSDHWLHLAADVAGVTVGGVERPAAAELTLRWALLQPRQEAEVTVGVKPRAAGNITVTLQLRLTHMDRSRRGEQVSAVTLRLLAERPAVELLSPEPGLLQFGTLPEDCRKLVPLTLVNLSRAAAPILLEVRSEGGAFHLPEPEPAAAASAARLSPSLAQFTLPAADASREGICPVTLSVALLTPCMDSSADCPPLRPVEGAVVVRLDGADPADEPLLVCRLAATVGRVKLRTRCREPIEMRCRPAETTSVSLPMKNTGNIPLEVRLTVTGLRDAVWVRPDRVTVPPRAERSVMLTFQPLDQFSGGDGVLVLTVQPDGLSFEVDIRGVVGERRAPPERPGRVGSPELMKSARRHRRGSRKSRSPRPRSAGREARDTAVQTSLLTLPGTSVVAPAPAASVRQPAASAPDRAAATKAQLGSNKHRLIWTGVSVGSAAAETLTLRNNSDTPLRLRIAIRDGPQFRIGQWEESCAVQELTVAPQQDQRVTVIYRPSQLEVTRAQLVIKPSPPPAGDRMVKFQIPLVAYSGSAEIQLNISPEDGIRLGEVHPGAGITTALTLANIGDRRAYVAIQAYRDSDCLHAVPAAEFLAQPSRLTLSAGEGRQVALCLRLPAGQPPPACLLLLTGEEVLRRAFKLVPAGRPVSSRYANLPALAADLGACFEGERKADVDESAAFRRLPNIADTFFGNVRQTQLPVHVTVRTMESTLFTNLHADDTVASVLNCAAFSAPRESRVVPAERDMSAPAAPPPPQAERAARQERQTLPACTPHQVRSSRRAPTPAAAVAPPAEAVVAAPAAVRRHLSNTSLESGPDGDGAAGSSAAAAAAGEAASDSGHLRLESEAVMFPATVLGQRSSGSLTFTNTSGVELRWSVEPLVKPWCTAGSEAAVGGDVFRFHPTQGEVKPSQCVQLAARFCPPSAGQFTQTFYLVTCADIGMAGSEHPALPSCQLVRVSGQGVDRPEGPPFPLTVQPDTIHFTADQRVIKLTINNKTRADHAFELHMTGPFAVNHAQMVSRARRYIHLPVMFQPPGPGLYAGRLSLRMLRPTGSAASRSHTQYTEFHVSLLGELS